MKKALVLIVSIITILGSNLFAKDIPLSQALEFNFPIREEIILEFPFEFKGVVPTPFISSNSEKESNAKPDFSSSENQLSLPPPSSVAKKDSNESTQFKQNIGSSSQGSNSLEVKKGKNILRIYARKSGTVQLTLFGFKFPIMIKLTFDENLPKEEINRYFNFVDLTEKKNIATEFEQNDHEVVISKLTVALNNNKTPKGYKKVVVNKETMIPEMQTKARLLYALIGNRYIGESWEITNMGGDGKYLEESFYSNGVYSVNFSNDQVDHGKTTRMFIVRNNTESSN